MTLRSRPIITYAAIALLVVMAGLFRFHVLRAEDEGERDDEQTIERDDIERTAEEEEDEESTVPAPVSESPNANIAEPTPPSNSIESVPALVIRDDNRNGIADSFEQLFLQSTL